MSCPTHGAVRFRSGPARLGALLATILLLSGCNGRTVMAPASAPGADAKPALATPPASIMTPQGY